MKIRYYADKMYTSDVGSPEPPGSGSPHLGKKGSNVFIGILFALAIVGAMWYVGRRSTKETET